MTHWYRFTVEADDPAAAEQRATSIELKLKSALTVASRSPSVRVYYDWLPARKAGWVPASRNGKPAGTLLRENRFSTWGANAVLLSGICLGAASYRSGCFDNADWRSLALGPAVDAWVRC